MLAQSGLRPDTIRKLKLKHVNPELTKQIIPCKIVVPEEITKGMFGSYFSFMGKESVRHLKAYLDRRSSKLGPEDYLFTSKGSDKQLESRALTKVFRCTIEGLKDKGIISFEQKAKGKPRDLRLYNLRSYFRNRAAKMGVEYVNFMMGHKANYRAAQIPASDAHYFSREQVETLRKLYRKEAMPHLRLESKTPSETEQTIQELRRQLETRNRGIEELKNTMQRIQPFIDFIKTFPDEETLQHFLSDLRNAKTVKLERKDAKEYHYFEIPDKTYERMREAGFKNIDELIKYLLRKEEEKEKSQQKT